METKIYGKVIGQFYKCPTTRFHARGLARLIRASHTKVNQILKTLAKHGLVRKASSKVAIEYEASLDSDNFHASKKLYNLASLQKLTRFLAERYGLPETIVLFGSYATGHDTETSDIDILIITNKELNLNLKKFENELNRKISIHEIKSLNTAKPEFINNLINGAVLYGYLKVL